ncbi:hypothetical protein BAE44_0008583 [Dichanthelium oligosanthes]|uniref:Uncharacterized protein n=1 Tax=Dichanthelium oligosanthes TaxID=888268 RepID=A0A1E5VZ41_9POAL|nr:hypothetical protein BAE44_0008583 [Dichanthelium oligosanthes]
MAAASRAWADFRGSFHWDEYDRAERRELSGDDVLALMFKGELTVEEAVSLLPDSKGELTVEEAISLLLPGEGNAVDAFLSLGVRIGLTTEELLLLQLLASFDRRGEDPELDQWRKVKGPVCPFFLFMMKASVKSGQVSWWQKKKSRFSPERPGYTAALRVARLGADGLHLEQAGEGGQPGALCYQIDRGYVKLRRPKGVVVFREGSDVPLTEVALVRRLPSGDGISITSHVDGLGVQLGDILFILPCSSATVALSFTEQSFKVPTKFTEEPLYGRVGLNFIDITVPIENLIKKLHGMYEQEEQDNKALLEQQNKGDHEDMSELMFCREEQEREREELMRQRKEQEEEKRESLHRSRAESRKNKLMRKEVKKMIAKLNLRPEKNERYEEEYCFNTLFSPPPDSG